MVRSAEMIARAALASECIGCKARPPDVMCVDESDLDMESADVFGLASGFFRPVVAGYCHDCCDGEWDEVLPLDGIDQEPALARDVLVWLERAGKRCRRGPRGAPRLARAASRPWWLMAGESVGVVISAVVIIPDLASTIRVYQRPEWQPDRGAMEE